MTGNRQTFEKTRYPGILRAHARGCSRLRCSCGYQAAVWSARENRKIKRHFPTLGEARTWRQDTASAVREGRVRAPVATTVRQAADALIEGMKNGIILDHSGTAYAPSTIRSYAEVLRLRVL